MSKELFLGILSFVLWGLFPIYFKSISADSIEILAYRVIFASIFGFMFIVLFKKNSSLKRIFYNKTIFLKLSLAGFFVTLNWGIYIYAVTNNQILEASIGQIINPLFFMLFGAIFLKEKISNLAKFSIFLIFIAIGIEIFANRSFSVVSIALPAAFAIYGLIKKKIQTPILESLFCETICLVPICVLYLFFIEFKGMGNFELNLNGILLIGAGLATLVPLITFNAATRTLNLATIGFLQYITPTITICFGIFIYEERVDLVKIISFLIIWIAVLINTFDSIKTKPKF
ncbi:EamA family transporter RarD [Campylobacter portucalensis]|nr:EamA family transporter RarD [Campylobacter portucalensis]